MTALIQALAVAEYLSFHRAARALGISQSSVSARIKTLEDDLGILLFERSTRGVRLTEAGRLFVERVAVGVDHLDHAVKTAGMAASGECGRLRIGIHALIPRSFLAELIRRYKEDHPGIEVEITEGAIRDTVMQLRAGRLDMVFAAGAPELPDCHSRRIWTEPLMAALPEHHRPAGQEAVSWGDLAGETFLVRHGGTGPQEAGTVQTGQRQYRPAERARRRDVAQDRPRSLTLARTIGRRMAREDFERLTAANDAAMTAAPAPTTRLETAATMAAPCRARRWKRES